MDIKYNFPSTFNVLLLLVINLPVPAIRDPMKEWGG